MIKGEGILEPLQLETITRCTDESLNIQVIEPYAVFVQADFKHLLWMLTKVSPPNSKDEEYFVHRKSARARVWGGGGRVGLRMLE
jgi:hypothetical protein